MKLILHRCQSFEKNTPWSLLILVWTLITICYLRRDGVGLRPCRFGHTEVCPVVGTDPGSESKIVCIPVARLATREIDIIRVGSQQCPGAQGFRSSLTEQILTAATL